jgi:hypothetical protein
MIFIDSRWPEKSSFFNEEEKKPLAGRKRENTESLTLMAQL